MGGQRTAGPRCRVWAARSWCRGCEFRHDAPQIEIGPGVRRAIVTDNVVAGAVRISVQGQGRVALGQNLGTA